MVIGRVPSLYCTMLNVGMHMFVKEYYKLRAKLKVMSLKMEENDENLQKTLLKHTWLKRSCSFATRVYDEGAVRSLGTNCNCVC